MTVSEMERIATLLKNYDSHLRDKAERYADMMSDWAEASQSETVRYANMYSTVRVERQRVNDSLLELEFAIKQLKDKSE